MDEAWRLEQELWQAVSTGRGGAFYARHMTADGFIVLPGAVIDRHELMLRWDKHEPLREYSLSEPRLVMVDGDSVLITYRVIADGEWLPNYRAQISALYTWIGGEWALAFRQHTPDGDHPFPFMTPNGPL
jgi:hypothetical protein